MRSQLLFCLGAKREAPKLSVTCFRVSGETTSVIFPGPEAQSSEASCLLACFTCFNSFWRNHLVLFFLGSKREAPKLLASLASELRAKPLASFVLGAGARSSDAISFTCSKSFRRFPNQIWRAFIFRVIVTFSV